ncbi:MAG: Slp family lipoprotein [Nitrospira sp.]|nr:Slp family lipoprotein [Nitrospira sp.]
MKITTLPALPVPLFGILTLMSACATYHVVPEHLEGRIQKDVSWEQVMQHPGRYDGATVMWGGKVLDVTQSSGRTQVEIMHLPLDRFLHPIDGPSTGRFSAIDTKQEMNDSAALQKDTLVTVIGEIRGRGQTAEGDPSDLYPTLLVRDMTAWQREVGTRNFPPGSPFTGSRPFLFWDSHRVAGHE